MAFVNHILRKTCNKNILLNGLVCSIGSCIFSKYKRITRMRDRPWLLCKSQFSRALGNVAADWSETKACETGLLLFIHWIKFFRVFFGVSSFCLSNICREKDMEWQIIATLMMVFYVKPTARLPGITWPAQIAMERRKFSPNSRSFKELLENNRTSLSPGIILNEKSS